MASSIPTPWTVDVLHYETGAEDEYGNDVEAWSAPDTQPVHGWGPAGSVEQGGWQRQVVADLQLYAPAGFRVGPHDRVVVDGRTFEVEGDVEDYTKGPFGFRPGLRVNLRKVSG
jgi:hypothetical protein